MMNTTSHVHVHAERALPAYPESIIVFIIAGFLCVNFPGSRFDLSRDLK